MEEKEDTSMASHSHSKKYRADKYESNYSFLEISSSNEWISDIYVKHFSDFDKEYSNSVSLLHSVLNNISIVDIVDRLESLCVSKFSEYDHYTNHSITTYFLPITCNKKFKLQSSDPKFNYLLKSKLVTVYGKKYDPFYSYQGLMSFEVRDGAFMPAKFKKYIPMTLQNKVFSIESGIEPTKFSYSVEKNKKVSNDNHYEGKLIYKYTSWYSYNDPIHNSTTLAKQSKIINELHNGDKIRIKFASPIQLKYIETTGSLAPLIAVPPREYNHLTHQFKHHRGIYVRDDSNVRTTWVNNFNLYYVVKNKPILIKSFCANNNDFDVVEYDVSNLYCDEVKEIIIEPTSQFPQFSMGLTFYGIINRDDHYDLRTIEYKLSFPNLNPNIVHKNKHSSRGFCDCTCCGKGSVNSKRGKKGKNNLFRNLIKEAMDNI